MERPIGVGAVPKRMHFRYPEGTTLTGTVIREVGEEFDAEEYGSYYFVIQLIEGLDGEKYVRFGYYRKKPGQDRYRWGSQTTYLATVDFTKELLKEAKKGDIL